MEVNSYLPPKFRPTLKPRSKSRSPTQQIKS